MQKLSNKAKERYCKAIRLLTFFGLVALICLVKRTPLVYAGSATPTPSGTLMGNAQKLLNDIYSRFVLFSTAAAGIGVGVGVFMRNFSMGKLHTIETGGRVIKDSIVGWAVLNALGLILNYLSSYTS